MAGIKSDVPTGPPSLSSVERSAADCRRTTRADHGRHISGRDPLEAKGSPFKIFMHDLNLALTGSVELSASKDGIGLELTIEERYQSAAGVDEVGPECDDQTNRWMDVLKSTSPTTEATDTGSAQVNLSGTSFYSGVSIWRLERLLSRENHYDVYASTSSVSLAIVNNHNYAWYVRVYNFTGLPDHVAKYRRRNMKRIASSHGAFRTLPCDGNIYVPFLTKTKANPVQIPFQDVLNSSPWVPSFYDLEKELSSLPNESSHSQLLQSSEWCCKWSIPVAGLEKTRKVSSNTDETSDSDTPELPATPGKEKARIKQRERRRRQRVQAKDSHTESNDHAEGATSGVSKTTPKRHNPHAMERNMQIITSIYDTDFPRSSPLPMIPGYNLPEFEFQAMLDSSRTVGRVVELEVNKVTFNSEYEMKAFLDLTRKDISFFKNLLVQVQSIQARTGERNNRNSSKVTYVWKLLPRIIDALEGRKRVIVNRYKHITRAYRKWHVAYKAGELPPEVQGLHRVFQSTIPDPPARKLPSSYTRQADHPSESYTEEERLWNIYRELLKGTTDS